MWCGADHGQALRQKHLSPTETEAGIPGDCIIYSISSSNSTFIWVMHGYSVPREVEQVFLLMITRIAEGSLGPGTKEAFTQ